MRRRGGAAALLLALLLLAGAGMDPQGLAAGSHRAPGHGWLPPPGRSTRDVTDYGRTPDRNHFTAEEPGYPLCMLWSRALGKSRSQPVVVQADMNADGVGETRIYHLAGDSLWALDDAGNVIWRQRVQDGYSASHPAYWRAADPSQDVIYAGTGKPSLIAVRATDGEVLGELMLPPSDGYNDCTGTPVRDFAPDYGVVTAPLVYPDGTVVLGTTDGEVWVVRGLADGSPVASRICLGGRISSSPVPVGDRAFIIASDGRVAGGAGSYGYVMAFWRSGSGHTDFEPRWPEPVFTPAGVPGEVAVDGTLIYFADKRGTIYAASLDDGRIMWHRATDGFINMGPGVDIEHVYFALRDPGGSGHGSLVALRKRSGVEAWSVPLPGDGNTAPVPLRRPGRALVLVGDTEAHITGWQAGEGPAAPSPFAIPLACAALAPEARGGGDLPPVSHDLVLTDDPYRSDRWWDPINGAGTQMVIGYDLMLLGVNANADGASVLQAYRLLPAVNFAVTGTVLAPPPFRPGDEVPVRLRVTARSNGPIRRLPVTVGWTVDGEVAGTPAVHYLDLPAGDGEERITVRLALPAPAAELWAVVNPEAVHRDPRGETLPPGLWPGGPYTDPTLAYEERLDDNIWRYGVSPPESEPEPPGDGPPGEDPPEDGSPPGDDPPGGGDPPGEGEPPGGRPPGGSPPGDDDPPGGGDPPGGDDPAPLDLAIERLDVPAGAPSSGFEIRVWAANRSAVPVTAEVRVTVEASEIARAEISFAAREVRELRYWSRVWPPGETVRTVAVIDPANRVPERNEDNNRREALTLIAAPPPGSPDRPPDFGSRLVD